VPQRQLNSPDAAAIVCVAVAVSHGCRRLRERICVPERVIANAVDANHLETATGTTGLVIVVATGVVVVIIVIVVIVVVVIAVIVVVIIIIVVATFLKECECARVQRR
jgi:hypothetical protein